MGAGLILHRQRRTPHANDAVPRRRAAELARRVHRELLRGRVDLARVRAVRLLLGGVVEPCDGDFGARQLLGALGAGLLGRGRRWEGPDRG
jgi:hypothetical protein